MVLKELLLNCDEKKADIEITGITCDSRQVKQGVAFVCITGSKSDGHDFARQASKSGAAVVLAERDTGVKNQIIVPDTHAAYADMCAAWFGHPAKSLKLIGVTGTNGKTSVTYMMKSILEAAGEKVGLVGTIQNMIGEEEVSSQNTTPGAYELNSLFAEMVKKGCRYVVMEVSSHALDQKRVYHLDFDVAMFTNLTRDHLDYHGTMENYLAAKRSLFAMCKTAVINSDDEYARRLTQGVDCKTVTYSAGNDSTYSAKGINYRPDSVEYEMVSDEFIQHIRVNTGGRFTVYNSMCAAVCALQLGIPIDIVTAGLAALKGVKGRAEVVEADRDFTIIIDYAHTPDGLKNILSTFKECRKNRLIVLFGCGGDRDKPKRPLMGEIAAHFADYCVITSDNPRSEEPGAIIEDILSGMSGTKTPTKIIVNRIEAIKFVVSIAQKDDIIVLAGKGHETYQILKDDKIHLDEREVVAEALAGL